MTTFVPFQQPLNSPMQFNATFDGSNYIVQVPWSLFGQRYYVTVMDQFGNLVFNIPRIGSTLDNNINLLQGYFKTSTMVFRTATNQFEINP